MSQDNVARIAYVREKRWITYTMAKQALDRMKWLLDGPPSKRKVNMMIIAETNNGKSHLLERFYDLHPIDPGRDGGQTVSPVLLIEMPSAPDEGRIYDEILSMLNAPFRHSDRVSKKKDLLSYYVKLLGVRMLMIDEFQHIAVATPRRQRECLNTIKLIGSQQELTIVGAGVKEALNVINSDPQLANRFEPFFLLKWTYSDDYLRLLASFEKLLPLRQQSGLTDERFAKELLGLSEGLIGEMATLLARATEAAINDGKERLTLDYVKNAVWATPSERKRALGRFH
ncbi:TniB family NTP-binding protein [Permianibacter aggregans]|nr:TniB family NTP-binding protein [Permianibacter aggregans]